MGWFEFTAAFLMFFVSHSLPMNPSVKPWLQSHLGAFGFSLLYSLMSLLMLTWLISAAGRAPYVALWGRALWQNHVVLILMLPVCLIIALSIARPNPFSFGSARNDQFDPDRPGIVRFTRHPLLLALLLWAAAHVVPNGDLAHVALFGSFTAFAGLGFRLVDRRKRREMGHEWQQCRNAVAKAQVLTAWPGLHTSLRLSAGLMLYAALIWLHPYLFCVSPLR